jgi:hypothetical protein
MAPAALKKGATYVLTADTPYFKNGPSQPMPADGVFRKDTRVTFVKNLGSYSLVQAKDGTRGYVPKTSIAPAPAR